MAPARFAVGLDTPLGLVRRLLRESRCEALPVMDDQNLVGIVTRSDLDSLSDASDRACSREIGRMRVVYCFADSDVAEAEAMMQAAEARSPGCTGRGCPLPGSPCTTGSATGLMKMLCARAARNNGVTSRFRCRAVSSDISCVPETCRQMILGTLKLMALPA